MATCENALSSAVEYQQLRCSTPCDQQVVLCPHILMDVPHCCFLSLPQSVSLPGCVFLSLSLSSFSPLLSLILSLSPLSLPRYLSFSLSLLFLSFAISHSLSLCLLFLPLYHSLSLSLLFFINILKPSANMSGYSLLMLPHKIQSLLHYMHTKWKCVSLCQFPCWMHRTVYLTIACD